MIKVIIVGHLLALSPLMNKTVNHPKFTAQVEKSQRLKLGDEWQFTTGTYYRPGFRGLSTIATRLPVKPKEVLFNRRHQRTDCQNVGTLCYMRGLEVGITRYLHGRHDYKNDAYKLGQTCTDICNELTRNHGKK